MVSRYMVLFGITYLRLDIFITWWMSIFQSTVVLRHFASLSVHHCILGHTPFSESIEPFSRLSFTFWLSCWSSWVVILGHIPSGWVCLHHYLGYPLVLGHLIRSFIILSVRVQFESGPHLYRSAISLSCQFSFWDRTYIDRSSSCQFRFLFSEPHLYQSVIVLLV